MPWAHEVAVGRPELPEVDVRPCRTGPAPGGTDAPAAPGPRPRVDVRVAGDLDLGNAPGLADGVLALVAGGADVVLDAGDVVFVDCCGLTALERCLVVGAGRVALARTSRPLDRLVARVAAPASPLRGGGHARVPRGD